VRKYLIVVVLILAVALFYLVLESQLPKPRALGYYTADSLVLAESKGVAIPSPGNVYYVAGVNVSVFQFVPSREEYASLKEQNEGKSGGDGLSFNPRYLCEDKDPGRVEIRFRNGEPIRGRLMASGLRQYVTSLRFDERATIVGWSSSGSRFGGWYHYYLARRFTGNFDSFIAFEFDKRSVGEDCQLRIDEGPWIHVPRTSLSSQGS